MSTQQGDDATAAPVAEARIRDKASSINMDGAVFSRPKSPMSSETKRKRDPDAQVAENSGEAVSGASDQSTRLVQQPSPKRARKSVSDPVQTFEPSNHEPSPSLHGLTPAIWQKVFNLLPPVFLGRLLRVSRGFNSLLTPGPASEIDTSPEESSPAQSIWLASRHRYAAGVPKALPSQSELDMWRLIRGSSCQICKERKPLLTMSSTADQWHAFADDGLRVIWPFGVRCCGACLQSQIEQESSLLFSSSTPSFLLAALPCVFLAGGTHYVYSSLVKNSTPPQDVQLSKVYYKPQIKAITDRFERIKADDSEKAKTWIDGLGREGNARTESILKWEHWEIKGGLKKVNMRPGARNASAAKQGSAPAQFLTQPQKSSLQQSPEPGETTESASQISIVRESNGLLPFDPNPPPNPNMQNPHFMQGGLPPRPPFSASGYRPERNLRDVTEAKAMRRADIERRAMELHPPIPPNILAHMDSFQAALQIPQPLTEQAWELLRPRLLDQREEAEKEEHGHLQRNKALSEIVHERTHTEFQPSQASETRDSVERAWDASQAPVRDRLALYADEQIRNRWSNGAAVHKGNCSAFAADLLLYVKRRFDEDEGSKAFKASNQTTTDASDDNVLILENMKWVFDNKIRPLTDPYQREIFLCSSCEGNSKYYGFEAVIQHYAAKHTTSLSQGSVVVHWRAKWPDQSPFHPSPGLAKSSYTLPTTTSFQPPSYSVLQDPHALPQETQNYQQATHWPNNPTNGYVNTQPTAAFPSDGYPSQQLPLPLQYSAQYTVVPHGQPPVSALPYVPSHSPSYGAPPAIQHHGQWSHYPASAPPATQPSLAEAQRNQTQLSEMAKHARDIWFSTAGVKDMPASVRIQVVIYHTATRFANVYNCDPSVAMFLDGLNQNAQMRPVRSLNGLLCKACQMSGSGQSDPLQAPNSGNERKSYTLPLLLNHFKSVHLGNPQPTSGALPGPASVQPNWTKHMVELADASVILSLINATGMDNNKLGLMAEALPEVFPNPLPKVGTYRGPVPDRLLGGGRTGSGSHRSKSPERLSPGISGANTSRRSLSSNGGAEPAGEDEYDPHRPAYLGAYVQSRKTSLPGQIDTESGIDPSSGRHWNRGRPEQQPHPSQNDYDPNQPMISYETRRQDSRPLSGPPKIELLEADRFLDKLQPDLERSAGLQSAFYRVGTVYKEDPSSQEGSSGAKDSEAPRAQYAERRTYEHPETIRYTDRPPPEHYTHSSHEPRGAGTHPYVQQSAYSLADRGAPGPHSREWADGPNMPREPVLPAAVRYVPASPYDVSRGGAAYPGHSPSGYPPWEYPPPQMQYVHPSEPSYGPRYGDYPEGRENRVEYIPVDGYGRDPRHVQRSPIGLPGTRAYVVESERRPEGASYEDPAYVSRSVRGEPEDRVLYREYR